jgi:deoxyadenosine/deoxycytidine kinase
MRQTDMFQPVGVADFMLEKDRLFAELTLDQNELKLYEQIYAKLSLEAPTPDLVIYLQAPADVLLQRIFKRGINYEQWIERRYLERLAEAYARFFHAYNDSPLLIVNAAAIDVVNNERDYEQLFQEITTIQRGRYFFNPASHTIL